MKNQLLPMVVTHKPSLINLATTTPTSELTKSFIGADLHDADLRGANLNGIDLRNANLNGADLKGAILSGADLRGATLSNADLRGASMSRIILSSATLSGADLRGADLHNAILSGANLWDANLSGSSLNRANLWDANLSGANLSGADFKGAILSSTDLRSANLSRANFWGANLRGANLNRANLTCVDFNSADLSTTNLLGANLTNADLSSAVVEDARFGENQGISELTECDLKQRGAIVSGASGKRKYFSSRSDNKNSVSQPDLLPELTSIASLDSPPQTFLPIQAVSGLSADSDAQPVPPTPAYADTDMPLEPNFRLDEFLPELEGCLTINKNKYEEDSWESNSHLEHQDIGSDRYLSPVARTASEIRNRKARLQAKTKGITSGSRGAARKPDYLM